MPLPFLAIAGIGAVAAAGAGKTIKALSDQSDANDINEEAQELVESSTKRANSFREASGKAINDLGEEKIQVLSGNMMSFVELFDKINNIELDESLGLDELSKFKIDKQDIKELKELTHTASSFMSGAVSGASIGAVTAFGAYGAAMTFGAASTGAAIGSLSGAAATNATLAFLGGGALSAGGLGMAGGTMILGGLAAAPAILVMGAVMGSKAKANKNKAYTNLAKAKEHAEEMKTIEVLCDGIRRKANLFQRTLIKLDMIFSSLIEDLRYVTSTSGYDYSKYTPDEKAVIARILSLAKAIKSVIDTPILNEDGSLCLDADKVIDSTNSLMIN